MLRRAGEGSSTYRIALAGRIIGRIAAEARARGSEVVLVHLIAQVYDDVWQNSFGMYLGAERLREIADAEGVHFVDTTGPLIAETRRTGERLHYERDAHPRPAGHAVIAQTVARFLKQNGLVDDGPVRCCGSV